MNWFRRRKPDGGHVMSGRTVYVAGYEDRTGLIYYLSYYYRAPVGWSSESTCSRHASEAIEFRTREQAEEAIRFAGSGDRLRFVIGCRSKYLLTRDRVMDEIENNPLPARPPLRDGTKMVTR